MKTAFNYLKRQIIFFFGFSAMCVLLVFTTFFISEKISVSGQEKDTSAIASEMLTVIIDPGHGGRDGGASTDDGVLEKDLNLS
ncbi:MAG: N-acetylmuramoyl-L-alanine amidase, partial [Eubacteriales bacterium]